MLRIGVSASSSNLPELSFGGLALSPSIAVYRPQAELFGGRSDGKFVVRLGKYEHCQTLIIARDN